MDNTNISTLALQVVDEMLEAGYKPNSVWNVYIFAYAPIVRFHHQCGQTRFDRQTMSEYTQNVETRFEYGEIGRGSRKQLLLAARRITQFNDVGKIDWGIGVKHLQLPAYYEEILNEILTCSIWKESVRRSIYGHAKRYFMWLLQEGHADLSSVNIWVLRKYMLSCTDHMKCHGVKSVRDYLKRLYSHLYDSGYILNAYGHFFSIRISVAHKIQPAVSKDELANSLTSINKNSASGKRDYAIILLGIVTGLRAVDISNLKLRDIDWANGEICIAQSKTGKSLALPLTVDVGRAIQDYILNARPQCNSENVFLRSVAPIKEFTSGCAVADIYDAVCSKAGQAHNGFHTIRRALGRDLTISGVSVTTTAQILGHVKLDSTKQYISLDSVHLKECAIDFKGIEPQSGVRS